MQRVDYRAAMLFNVNIAIEHNFIVNNCKTKLRSKPQGPPVYQWCISFSPVFQSIAGKRFPLPYHYTSPNSFAFARRLIRDYTACEAQEQ